MTYTSQHSTSKRLVGFGLVALFHVFLVYMLASGLGSSVVKIIRGPIETKIIEEVKETKKAPPPPPPKFEQPPPFVPPPEVSIALPAESSSTAISQTTSRIAPPAPKPAAVVTTPPRSDPKHPVTQPPYPPTSVRLEEQGSVILALYIQADGRVSDAKVQKSSGYARLDEAAVREAMKGSWHFFPATQGGAPVPAWHAIKVTFRLQQ
jgi:protein TonB